MKQYSTTYTSPEFQKSSPELLLSQRVHILARAVENIRPHAPVEATVIPLSQEVINHTVRQEANRGISELEQMLHSEAVQDLTIERLADTAKNYALGEGNPLIDEAFRNAQENL